eukprot:TRINITY_DN108651_c0_g1_i1.p1 TRINITY_DN108651_c0_g1~~TRINITY_DN108651_c0_g1_i1.p1  ORF type:complete len:610 (-),score=105.23 TRINITY_DN108651_c0_g1_i1:67-1896(-)
MRLILEASKRHTFFCSNGLTFVLSVALVHGWEALSPEEVARAKPLLWGALQGNFMLDVSPWPMNTHDVLELFDEHLPALSFPELSSTAITFLVPRCPTGLAERLEKLFSPSHLFVGFGDDLCSQPEGQKKRGKTKVVHYPGSWKRPAGLVLNEMLQDVETPLVMVLLGAAVPGSSSDLERMVRVLQSSRVAAVSGSLVDSDRVFSDFCYRLRLRPYHLSFDSTYEYSLNFGEDESASVRGYWFHEAHSEEKDGPCKLCETLAPTFLARTAVLRALPMFNPSLDGEWALLDFALRATRVPLSAQAADKLDSGLGRRHVPLLFASCPFASFHEVEGLAGPHLYARRDKPQGKSISDPWFGDDASALGHIWGARTDSDDLKPFTQAQRFMESNDLRVIATPDQQERHFGCRLETVNCPVPNWIYRGWAVPPCCKETMRHLLFYIDDVFRELGIRYIVTDGVLLGSYKMGGMLDWDADVDLHIHDDDFGRIEDEVVERAAQDGHYIRKHENNASFLLQANDHNYLLIELNKRGEFWDPDLVWQVPIEGRLFPAMEKAHLNLSAWYGMSFFRHRLRHVPPWEEELRPMYCATPYHYNCVDTVPQGLDCHRHGRC